MPSTIWGLPAEDVIVPVVAWTIIATYYVFQTIKRVYDRRHALHDMKDHNTYHRNYFFHMRNGWVRFNHLTLQGTANSTRDYLRVLLFMEGTTASIGSLILGYAVILLDESNNRDRLLFAQLCVGVIIFSVMFFMFLFATRYAVILHFLMNVEEDIHGVPLDPKVIDGVFNNSHLYYGAALRLYYAAIPLFCWVVSTWALVAVCPFYIWMMKDYDNNIYLEEELEEMFKNSDLGRSPKASKSAVD